MGRAFAGLFGGFLSLLIVLPFMGDGFHSVSQSEAAKVEGGDSTNAFCGNLSPYNITACGTAANYCGGYLGCSSLTCLSCEEITIPVLQGSGVSIESQTPSCPLGDLNGICLSFFTGCYCTGTPINNVSCGNYTLYTIGGNACGG